MLPQSTLHARRYFRSIPPRGIGIIQSYRFQGVRHLLIQLEISKSGGRMKIVPINNLDAKGRGRMWPNLGVPLIDNQLCLEPSLLDVSLDNHQVSVVVR